LKDQREYVAKLFVGVAMLERSRQIDPELMSWGATSTLGAYHARSSMAELDEAKKLFDQAFEKIKGLLLGVHLNYAQYACVTNNQSLYESMLQKAVSASDVDPELRLQNAVARRRAVRALSKPAMEECGFHAPARLVALFGGS